MLRARKESYVPVNNPNNTYSLHKSTIYVPVAPRNMMQITFRSSSCRKKSLISYNSLAVKKNNVFLNPFACVWLMETAEKPPPNSTKCEIFLKFKRESRQSILSPMSVFTILSYSSTILIWQLKYPDYFAQESRQYFILPSASLNTKV